MLISLEVIRVCNYRGRPRSAADTSLQLPWPPIFFLSTHALQIHHCNYPGHLFCFFLQVHGFYIIVTTIATYFHQCKYLFLQVHCRYIIATVPRVHFALKCDFLNLSVCNTKSSFSNTSFQLLPSVHCFDITATAPAPYFHWHIVLPE